MAWLTLIVDTDAQHAESLSDALLEHGALSVDLLDADADTPDEQAIFGEPGEPPPVPLRLMRPDASHGNRANIMRRWRAVRRADRLRRISVSAPGRRPKQV